MLNYHELTMNEPRDSPARRKQFLVICTVMAAVFVHSSLSAGLLDPVVISDGAFPGGEFVYKPLVRDYVAMGGMFRILAEDLGFVRDRGWGAQPRGDGDLGGVLYALFLDGDSDVAVGERRFMSGVLLPEEEWEGDGWTGLRGEDATVAKRTLMELNEKRAAMAGAASSAGDASEDFEEVLRKSPYELGRLPSTKAATTSFVYTNGFLSAFMHQFKVFPALAKYARANGVEGASVVMSTTCDVRKQMCIHYAILAESNAFFLGRPDSDEYSAELTAKNGSKKDSLSLAWRGLKKIFGFESKATEKVSEEL